MRGLWLCLLLAIAGFSGTSPRAEAGDYRAGTHYDVISPAIRTRDPSRIEVVEFFAYSCGHCYSFEPLVKKWRRGLAADVDFRPSPAVWAAPMELHARAYFAAAALGVLDKVHGAIFAAMHVDRKRLSGEAEIRRVFVDNGVSGEDFDRAFRSFGVGSQARQAGALARSARIAGTPEMMVAGKYRIGARKAGGQAEMLEVVDYLVEKERMARVAAARTSAE